MEYGLIGITLAHSFSQAVHSRINRYDYRLQEVAPEALEAFIKEKNFKGINVTIPYKQDVIPYLDEISERGRHVGAVNTVVHKDGKLYGDNTDFGGMELQLRHMGLELAGKKVLILGTGGTSKTAYAVAEHLGASEVYKVSRSGMDGALTYEEASTLHKDAKILINTTPAGMYPNVDTMAVDPAEFPKLEGLLDAVYNPLSTKLVMEARKLGIKAEGGLYMLVAQAVLAAELFLGEKLPESLMEEIYSDILMEKQNIVLTGMPGSGKSTVGRMLEKMTGRKCIESDAVIVETAGVEITQIFAEHGEEYFRKMESDIIKDLSVKNGQIISTGGGVPTRPHNMEALRQNGVVFFLDRPLEDLLPTDDRPLANDAEKIKRLYKERYGIYTQTCDCRISVKGTPMDVAEEILSQLGIPGKRL